MKKQQLLPVLGLAPLVPVVAMGGLPWIALPALGALVLIGVVVGEWQRRRTLLAVLQLAPPGSVVEQERGLGGPGMRIRVGGAVPRPRRRR
ncbi:hypothetical protein RB200_28875 [Streptomyces sp. PmtG]